MISPISAQEGPRIPLTSKIDFVTYVKIYFTTSNVSLNNVCKKAFNNCYRKLGNIFLCLTLVTHLAFVEFSLTTRKCGNLSLKHRLSASVLMHHYTLGLRPRDVTMRLSTFPRWYNQLYLICYQSRHSRTFLSRDITIL